jgi:serine protease inhibitor
VLTDALYLHAAWAAPFDPDDTGPGPFTTAAGSRVTAQFITNGPYRAVRVGGWTAVWLPYSGGQLAMEALLPPAGAGCTSTSSRRHLYLDHPVRSPVHHRTRSVSHLTGAASG